MMKNTQTVGLLLLIGGVILLLLFSMIGSVQELDIAKVPIAVIIGVLAIVVGGIALLVSIFFEQQSDMNQRKKEIKKEDFEP